MALKRCFIFAFLMIHAFGLSSAEAYRPDEGPRIGVGGSGEAQGGAATGLGDGLAAPGSGLGKGLVIVPEDIPERPDVIGDDDMGDTPFGAAGEDHHDAEAEAGAPRPRATLADVSDDPAALPAPVRSTRQALLAAARSGDIEALRPIFDGQRVQPIVAPMGSMAEATVGEGRDAIASLRLQSGDPDGHEILAILVELLEAGYVSVGEGSTQTYVWPYFAEVAIDGLPPANRVDVYRVLTSIDVEEVEQLGRYTFFRVGIAPDGRVRYFSAGDLE